MCENHFREFIPPELCKATLFSVNHCVYSNVSLLYINSGLSTQGCYFMFAFSLIMDGNEVHPCSASRTNFSFCNFRVRENVGFFQQLHLFATDSCISNSVWFQITQVWFVFSTGPKSPKPFKVYGFKCAWKIYLPWGFKVFQSKNARSNEQNAEKHWMLTRYKEIRWY